MSPGKGIEYALSALPPVVEKFPNLCYIVLGATHPNILREEGESYRLSLQRQARDLGSQRNVLFNSRFVSLEELCEFLKAADIYLTPYLNREQITSGTLAYALGAGKPIVSTPYWYAEELLADSRGVLVDFRSPGSISNALLDLLNDPDRVLELRTNAYEFSRRMTWTEVGRAVPGDLPPGDQHRPRARLHAGREPALHAAHHRAAPAEAGPPLHPADRRHGPAPARQVHGARPLARLLHGRQRARSGGDHEVL